MKKRTRQMLNLNNLNDPNLDIQNACQGHLTENELQCQVLLHPNKILSVITDVSLNGLSKEDGEFWQRLFCRQSSLLYPIKFAVKENLSVIQMIAEMPITDENDLANGYTVLKEGIFHGAGLLNSIHSDSSIIIEGKKKKLKEKSIPMEEVKKSIQKVLNNKYEYSEKTNQWIISINTDDFFQRMVVCLDSSVKLLKVSTNCCQVSESQYSSVLALILFLLQSTGRIRFVRGLMSDSDKKTVGLEIVFPFVLLKDIPLEKVIESMILGIGFLKRPCEVLVNKEAATTYLKKIWGISSVKS